MKLFLTLLLTLGLTALLSAQPTPKPTPTIKSGLQSYFATENWALTEREIAGNGASKLADQAAQLQALFTKLLKRKQDTAEDRILVFEMNRATAAIQKAQSDKTQWAEAWRAVTSLKTAALK